MLETNLSDQDSGINLEDPIVVLKLKRCTSVAEFEELIKNENNAIHLDLLTKAETNYEDLLRLYQTSSSRTIVSFNFHDDSRPVSEIFKKIRWESYYGQKVIYNLQSGDLPEELTDRNPYGLIFPKSRANASTERNKISNRNVLLDLILFSPAGITLFEGNSIKRLSSELMITEPQTSNVDVRHNGFKIANSHFRIGTKIHISDFYFAKRFFQNGYFANRFAYLIAKTILDEHIPSIKRNAKSETESDPLLNLTLIGYGQYSELMISTVKAILMNATSEFRINHNLISDEETLERIKVYEPIYENVIIIVPISSTFTTSLKIEGLLFLTHPSTQIIEPHLNVLNVYDNSEKQSSKDISVIESKFRWSDIDLTSKTILVKFSNSKSHNPKRQRYYIRLPTRWLDVKDCELCFAEDPTKETPLFNTDRTSVTPVLIFDTPKGRALKSTNKGLLATEMLRYGHFMGHFNHNLYLINREFFFIENKINIEKWLRDLLNKNPSLFDRTQPTTIIAPGHYSNVGFASIVNKILFGNVANIIHYDPNDDHAQNFNTFYGSEINGNLGQTRLFFVDDMLVSGTTFTNCMNVLKYTRNDYKGFEGCIVLIDRSNDFVQRNVLLELGSDSERFMSFTDLLLTSIYNFDNSCPICMEKERYDRLVTLSYLEKTQVHFASQSNKLTLKNGNHLEENPIRSNTYIRRVEATHRIYDWFFKTKNQYDRKVELFPSLHDWVSDVLHLTQEPFSETVLTNSEEETIDETFMKVLTQSPMTHYMPVKVMVFGWVLKEIDNHSSAILKLLNDDLLNYGSFRKLKFLIRRVGQLQSNYLISNTFLNFLNELYGKRGIPRLLDDIARKKSEIQTSDAQLQKQETSLKSFFVFYTSQIKELLYLNEAKTIRLEIIVQAFLGKRNLNPGFKQILRILQEENGLLITNFTDDLTQNPKFERMFIDSAGKDGMKRFFERKSISNSFRFKDVEEFLNIGYAELARKKLSANNDFLNYVYLVNFLRKEKNRDQSLITKVETIMNRIRRIVFDHDLDNGAFLAVRYKRNTKDNLFFAYNRGTRGAIKEFYPKEANNYFTEFLYGKIDSTGNSSITIVELCKNTNGHWEDLYSDDDKKLSPPLFRKGLIPDDYNRVLLLRINRLPFFKSGQADNKGEAQAIICFYSKQTGHLPTDIRKVRYLLLLRSLLSTFIEEHHGNNEFKDWMDAMLKRRTSLLTGHGREMLMDLSKVSSEKIDYKNILFTILLTQKTILDEMDLNGMAQGRKLVDLKNFLNLGNDIVDKLYCEDTLKTMAEEIFSFDLIENREPLDVEVTFDCSPFLFPFQVLECICFELFINAKKNRYTFFPDEEVVASTDKDLKFRKNKIWIEVKDLPGSDVEFKISNTGPMLSAHVKDSLENNHNIKDTGEIGGLEMIATILKRFRFGEASYIYPIINKQHYLHKFCCVLTLSVTKSRSRDE